MDPRLPWRLKYPIAVVSLAFGGGVLGLFFLLLALLIYLIDPSGFTRSYGPFAPVALVYLKGGALGGLMAGIAWPLTRWLIGTMFAGICLVYPLYYYAGRLILGPDTGSAEIPYIAGGLAAFTGIFVGLKLWRDPTLADVLARSQSR